MVNTVTKQTLIDGERNLVVKVQISGDGSGEETNTNLIDISTYNLPNATCKINRIKAMLVGFSMQLIWDADTDVKAQDVRAGENEMDFKKWGGLINNAGVGVTGDILFTTLGLGSGDEGTITLEMVKN